MRPDTNTVAHVLEPAGISAEFTDERFGLLCRVRADDVAKALAALAADGYEMLVDLFASDTGEGIELTYHVRSFGGDTEFYVRASVAYDGPVPSVWETHAAALYAEREAAELFGISFPGHPNPKRLLTGDDVDEFFMRKDVLVRTHEEVMRGE